MWKSVRVACLVLAVAGAVPTPTRADDLPQVDGNNEVVPLRPDQLTPAEQATYASLSPGSDQASKYLVSRSWMRFCKPVADGAIPPKRLPLIPGKFDQSYLTADELSVCKVAIRLFFRPA